MNTNATSLSVSIKALPAVHVAYIDYNANAEPAEFHHGIRKCFERVQTWVKERGYDPYTLLNVGVPTVVDGQLKHYGCCVQVPEEVQKGSDGVDGVRIKALPGGRYAVVSIKKEPRLIGASIGRFYQVYVPQNKLQLDGTRPTYEIYYDSTMEYCVAIL